MMEPLRFLVTAGPTREPIDAVRFLSNASSGRMGYAVARAAAEAGHEVTLVSGPTALDPPGGARCIRVQTAAEMADAVFAALDGCTCLVMAAAVADYRPRDVFPGKRKKGEGTLHLALERTVDILAAAGRRKGGRILVGFAVETENLLANARDKLRAKNLDLIVANGVDAFAGGRTSASFLTAEGDRRSFSSVSKDELARALVAWVADRARRG